MKKILAYVLASVVLILTYAVTMFIIDMIFGWFGGEDGVSWISIAAGCIAATAGIIIVDPMTLCGYVLRYRAVCPSLQIFPQHPQCFSMQRYCAILYSRVFRRYGPCTSRSWPA